MIAVSVQILISSVARLKKKIKHGWALRRPRGAIGAGQPSHHSQYSGRYLSKFNVRKNNRREHWGKTCPLRLWNVSRFSQEQWRKKKNKTRKRVDRKPFSLSNGRSPVAGRIGWVYFETDEDDDVCWWGRMMYPAH
jgi:hypothetical protein